MIRATAVVSHRRRVPSRRTATAKRATGVRSCLTYNSVGHIIAAATCAPVGTTFHYYSYNIAKDGVEQIVDHLNQLTRTVISIS